MAIGHSCNTDKFANVVTKKENFENLEQNKGISMEQNKGISTYNSEGSILSQNFRRVIFSDNTKLYERLASSDAVLRASL